MTEHTPTPWRLCTTGNLGSAIEAPSGKKYSNLDDGYRIVASYQECTASELFLEQEANRRANGAFIVKAVNNHEALAEALADLIEAVRRDSDEGGKGISGYTAARMSDARAVLRDLVGTGKE